MIFSTELARANSIHRLGWILQRPASSGQLVSLSVLFARCLDQEPYVDIFCRTRRDQRLMSQDINYLFHEINDNHETANGQEETRERRVARGHCLVKRWPDAVISVKDAQCARKRHQRSKENQRLGATQRHARGPM